MNKDHERSHAGEKSLVPPRHEMTHIEEKTFSCIPCDKTFSPNGLNKTHTETFKCTSCNQIYDLKGHETIHNGEKNFRCTSCDKSYDLKGHEKTHTGEKTFKCSSFIKSYDLKGHEKPHIGEKAFKYTNCDKSSNLKSQRGENFLKMGSLNICGGLFDKEELIIETIHRNNIDIMCLSEAQIHNYYPTKPFTIKGFKTYLPLEREKSTTVRLICLVKEDLEVKLREDLMSSQICTVWLETNGKDGKKVLLSFMYREFNDLAECGKLSIT